MNPCRAVPCLFTVSLLVALLPGLPGSLAAQDADEASVWEREAEFSFVSTSGNTSTRTLGTGLQVGYRPEGWDLSTKASFVRSTAEGETNAEALTALLRAGKVITPRIQGFGEATYLRNRFAGIRHRISPELGAAFELLENDAHSLRAKAAAGYVRETRLAQETRSFASGNTGFNYTWALSPTAEFSNEGSFTSNLQEGEDWRIANRAALRVAVTSIFSVRLSHTLEHLNQPVPGFEETDTRISAALVAAF